MLKLMVSHNCGVSYVLDKTAETKEELLPRMKELDHQMLRWYVDQDGEQVFDEDYVCGVHKDILGFIETLREETKKEELLHRDNDQ